MLDFIGRFFKAQQTCYQDIILVKKLALQSLSLPLQIRPRNKHQIYGEIQDFPIQTVFFRSRYKLILPKNMFQSQLFISTFYSESTIHTGSIILSNQYITFMQNKSSTDIDRKLAIYYHPLFQEIIKAIIDLFNTKAEKFEIGLLQFVEFNLKLQKSLLPSFQVDNALISALNDWVKQVAECLTYQGMVSTANCVQITGNNLPQLIKKQYNDSHIKLFAQQKQYMQQMMKISNHDAFKLLGVKINKQVFSKFMFDLCSTWCEFLDIELFSYFLIAMYIQISKGETIETSIFKDTFSMETIDIEFMEEFEEVKNYYSRNRKKDLRYYRAWCEWNYLRVNQVGEKLILKLDEIHVDDNRILQLAMIFERSIKIINQQITSQNPQQGKAQTEQKNESEKQNSQEFLILKKLDVDPNKVHGKQKQSDKIKKEDFEEEDYADIYKQYFQEQQEPVLGQDFQIEIDEFGNMYLKRIVKLPVLGIKIEPENRQKQLQLKKKYLQQKNKQFREISNLYGRMDQLKVRLEHSVKNDYYTFKKNEKIKIRDQFYKKQKNQKADNPMERTIHEKMKPKQPQHEEFKTEKQESIKIKKEVKQQIHQNHDYIHKIMAPPFLTDNQNNISFIQGKQGEIYSTTANNQKRSLKLGIAKVKNMDFRVKQLKSYHLVGKLATDRNVINNKIRAESFSIHKMKEQEQEKLQKAKEENKYIWSRYIDEGEVENMNNYSQFYKKLEVAKKRFGREFQSEYRTNLKPILAYENRRHEMGGIIEKEDQQRFSERIKRLINKQNRKNRKRQKKQKLRNYRRNFKNKTDKKIFEDIFIGYHRNAIKSIKQERKQHNSMIVK